MYLTVSIVAGRVKRTRSSLAAIKRWNELSRGEGEGRRVGMCQLEPSTLELTSWRLQLLFQQLNHRTRLAFATHSMGNKQSHKQPSEPECVRLYLLVNEGTSSPFTKKLVNSWLNLNTWTPCWHRQTYDGCYVYQDTRDERVCLLSTQNGKRLVWSHVTR